MTKEKFTIEVTNNSEDVMRSYMGSIKNENGNILSQVVMYWDEEAGEDEDSDEIPYFEYTVSKNTYRANKEFFDKFAKDMGFEIEIADWEEDDNDWGGVMIQGELDVSPIKKTVRKLTGDFLKTLKDNGVTPFADEINGWIDSSKTEAGVNKSPVNESFRSRENLNRLKTRAQSTKGYIDDDITLVDLVSRD